MLSKRFKQQGIQAYITHANSQPAKLANMAKGAGSALDNSQPASKVKKRTMVPQLCRMIWRS